jgi:hypothetical protein
VRPGLPALSTINSHRTLRISAPRNGSLRHSRSMNLPHAWLSLFSAEQFIVGRLFFGGADNHSETAESQFARRKQR